MLSVYVAIILSHTSTHTTRVLVPRDKSFWMMKIQVVLRWCRANWGVIMSHPGGFRASGVLDTLMKQSKMVQILQATAQEVEKMGGNSVDSNGHASPSALLPRESLPHKQPKESPQPLRAFMQYIGRSGTESHSSMRWTCDWNCGFISTCFDEVAQHEKTCTRGRVLLTVPNGKRPGDLFSTEVPGHGVMLPVADCQAYALRPEIVDIDIVELLEDPFLREQRGGHLEPRRGMVNRWAG